MSEAGRSSIQPSITYHFAILPPPPPPCLVADALGRLRARDLLCKRFLLLFLRLRESSAGQERERSNAALLDAVRDAGEEGPVGARFPGGRRVPRRVSRVRVIRRYARLSLARTPHLLAFMPPDVHASGMGSKADKQGAHNPKMRTSVSCTYPALARFMPSDLRTLGMGSLTLWHTKDTLWSTIAPSQPPASPQVGSGPAALFCRPRRAAAFGGALLSLGDGQDHAAGRRHKRKHYVCLNALRPLSRPFERPRMPSQASVHFVYSLVWVCPSPLPRSRILRWWYLALNQGRCMPWPTAPLCVRRRILP